MGWGDRISPQTGAEQDKLPGLKETKWHTMATAQEVAERNDRRGGEAEVGNGGAPVMGWREQGLRFSLSPQGARSEAEAVG